MFITHFQDDRCSPFLSFAFLMIMTEQQLQSDITKKGGGRMTWDQTTLFSCHMLHSECLMGLNVFVIGPCVSVCVLEEEEDGEAK